MADFSINATQLSAPTGAGTAPLAAVQEQSVQVDYISPFKGVIEIFEKGFEQSRKAEAEKLKNSVVGAYAREQKMINDGVASGELNPRTAAIKSKATLGTYLANYSQYTKELNELRTAFAGGTELGDIEDAGKAEAKVKHDRIAYAMSKGGQIRPWMSDAEIDVEYEKVRRQENITNDFERKRAMNAENRAQGLYDDGQRDRRDRESAFTLMQDTANLHLNSSSSFIRGLNDRVKKGMTKEEAELEINTYFSQIDQSLLLISKTNPADAKHFQSLFDSAREIARRSIDPKVAAEDVGNQLKLLIGRAQVQAIQDPEFRNTVALSELTKNNPTSALSFLKLAPLAMARLAGDKATVQTKDIPSVVGDPDAEKDVIKFLNDNISKLGTPVFKDNVKAERETANVINNVLSQTAKEYTSKSASDAKKFVELAKFYASPSFGKMAASGLLSKEAQAGAYNAWTTTFVPAVQDSVQRTLSQAVTGYSSRPSADAIDKPLSVSDIVDVKFSGSGVLFTAKVDPKLSRMEQEEQRKAVDSLRTSQEALTQLVRTGAHLEGNMKYDEYWEKNKYIFLPQIYPAAPGVVVNGYRSKGLAGNDPNNWEKVK